MSYDLNTAKARIDSLRREIEHHRKLYYENDAPEISDFAFDALFEELKALGCLSVPGSARFSLPPGGRQCVGEICRGEARGADGISDRRVRF